MTAADFGPADLALSLVMAAALGAFVMSWACAASRADEEIEREYHARQRERDETGA